MTPITRPLGDNFPSVKIETGKGGSTSTNVDASTNKSLPFIWFNGVLGALALGLAVGALVIAVRESDHEKSRAIEVEQRLQHDSDVAQNHWRNDEVDLRTLQSDMKKLNEVTYARSKH